MRVLITICARGGSKGIPGKNIKKIGDKPLIYYSLVVAKMFQEKNENVDVVLSTDSEEIKEAAKSLNVGNVDFSYMRPAYLATDTVGKLDVIKDVLLYKEEKGKRDLKYDYVLDLDVTSPFRTLEDLEEAFAILERSDAYDIFSVSPANRNPYFNMVEQNEKGYYSLSKKGDFLTRQSAPKVYDMNASFYIYKKDFFEQDTKTAITEKSLIYEMQHTCFDLDHPIDFEFMDYLIRNNGLDFNFGQK